MKLNKRHITFNILFFSIVLSILSITLPAGSVKASPEKLSAEFIYKTAWKTINDKFYLRNNKFKLQDWENKFDGKINNQNDAHVCIQKFVRKLNDPYTKFLSKEEYLDEKEKISSKLVGIGIKIAPFEPIILSVLPGSPADKAGIKPEDKIFSINKKRTNSLSSIEVSKLLSGPKGTVVSVGVKRGNNILNKTLVRDEIKITSVSSKMLNKNIGLVKVSTFIPENTSTLFKKEVLSLMPTGGLIIDLRDNSGGLLKNAIQIADLLLDEGKIVTAVGKNGKVHEHANSNKIYDGNIVILVNEYTASASEIITGALRDNGKAVVLGRKTFGKGLIQEIVELPDSSALHITIGAYLTPSGKNINKVGIKPDLIVKKTKKQLDNAIKILEKAPKESSLLASL